MSFTVALSAASTSTVTVAYATADGTAVAGLDYVSTSGTLTFSPGESTRTVTVVVNGDTANEPNETFVVNLSAPADATISDGQGVGTITNDECGVPTPGVADGTFEAGSPWPSWTVQTSTNFGSPLCNPTLCGTALPPYAGDNWAWFGGADTPEVGTLGQTVTLPLSSSLTLLFQMRATASPTDTLDIFVDGTPVQGFVAPTSPESGYSLRQIDLTSFADGGSHALLFRYDGPEGLGGSFLVDNIELSSCPPSFSINDVGLTEGNSGTTTATFTVTLSPARASSVTVAYATADGTAKAGSDYVSTSGILTFAPGQATQPITVSVTGDATSEPNETFFVNLSGATNATITDGQGVGTITNDECTGGSPPGMAGPIDGTFEAGDPWPGWTVQTSTNFGTPLCNTSLCGTGGGVAAPFAGDNWAWFGGVGAVESSSVGQNVTLPVASSLTLGFQMRVGGVSLPFTDTLVITVDGTAVHTFTEPASAESAYTLRQVDLTSFADGASHALLFSHSGPTTEIMNFTVDNVELLSCPLPDLIFKDGFQ